MITEPRNVIGHLADVAADNDRLREEVRALVTERDKMREGLATAIDLADWAIGMIDADHPVFRGERARDCLAKVRKAMGSAA